MQPTKYHCIFTNDQIFQASSLEEASSFPNLKHLVKEDFIKYYQSNVYSYPIFKYQIINDDGSDRGLVVGTFKLLSIGEDITTSSSISKRDLLIQNLTNQQIHKYSIAGYWPAFFTDKVLPLMNDLNNYGSYEAYCQSFEVDHLKSKIENLEKEVIRLKSQIG